MRGRGGQAARMATPAPVTVLGVTGTWKDFEHQWKRAAGEGDESGLVGQRGQSWWRNRI